MVSICNVYIGKLNMPFALCDIVCVCVYCWHSDLIKMVAAARTPESLDLVV